MEQTKHNSELYSGLIASVVQNDLKGVEKYWRLGADVKAFGDDALRIAAKNGNKALALLLRSYGSSEDRAVAEAAVRGDVVTVKRLVEYFPQSFSIRTLRAAFAPKSRKKATSTKTPKNIPSRKNSQSQARA